ncbi:MAG: type VI secretion system membrane subunit TssM [Rhizobiaceae bacterium]
MIGAAFERAFRPFGIVTIVAALLALLVFFLGPLLAVGDMRPLAPAAVRLAILLVIALAWGIAGLLLRGRRDAQGGAEDTERRERDEKKTAARREQAAANEEFALFADSARRARRVLAESRWLNPFGGERRSLPRYLVVGPKESGKTTLLRNAGLSIADEGAAPAAAPPPADLMLSEHGVFIELASPYLQQAEETQKAVWRRMLTYIRHWRPTQPLSGILVTLDAGALAGALPDKAEALGTLLRKRLDEIAERLRARPPVYLVLTKLDLLVGFEEFFDSLNMDERDARLGFQISTPNDGAGSAVERFSAGFEDTLDRLSGQQLRRLQEETDERLRLRVFEFPGQFALLKSRLMPLVEQISAPSRFGAAPLLRGVFFASALQTGLSRDALQGAMAPLFAFRPDAVALKDRRAALHSRPFFLRGLQQTVLAEAGMAGFSRSAAAARRVEAISLNLLVALAIVAFGVVWWLSFSSGRAYTARLSDEIGTARAALTAIDDRANAAPDFARAATALDSLAALEKERPDWVTLGLYSSAPATAAARKTYDLGLKNLFLPYVLSYAHSALDAPALDVVSRFRLLKYYLMLGGVRPVDPAVAAAIAPGFADAMAPGDGEQAARMRAHLVALASVDLSKQKLDKALVDRARGRIGEAGLAELGYDMLQSRPDVQSLPPWRPVDHMGTEGPQALARVSGTSLWNGIPGLYTLDGYRSWMMPHSQEVSTRIADDLWVMGEQGSKLDTRQQAGRIREGMLELYAVGYNREWDSLLADLTIAPTADAGQAAKLVSILTAAPSPIDELLTAIAEQTNLAGASGALSMAESALASRVPLYPAMPRKVANVESRVTEHFAQFAAAVGASRKPAEKDKPAAPAEVDVVLAALKPLYSDLNLIATGGDILKLGNKPQDTLDQLDEMTRKLPDQLRPFFQRIVFRMAAVTGAGARARLADIWSSTVLPACRSLVSGHYPFDPKSELEASTNDFAAVFGPKGAITAFRDGYLTPFIDTSASPWKWRSGNTIGLGLDDSVLSPFERASEISATYFDAGGNPGVTFTVTPMGLDGAANAAQFEHNGQTDIYDHGPAAISTVAWPAPAKDSEIALSVTPEIAGQKNIILWQGPWALFRLLDAGREADAGKKEPGEETLRFAVGSRWVKLKFAAPSARAIIKGDLLRGFACPHLTGEEQVTGAVEERGTRQQ